MCVTNTLCSALLHFSSSLENSAFLFEPGKPLPPWRQPHNNTQTQIEPHSQTSRSQCPPLKPPYSQPGVFPRGQIYTVSLSSATVFNMFWSVCLTSCTVLLFFCLPPCASKRVCEV